MEKDRKLSIDIFVSPSEKEKQGWPGNFFRATS
jgi:hypothetical protein